MHRPDRLVLLAVFVVLAVLRLIRYLKVGAGKRAQTGIPASGGVPTPLTPPAAGSPSPIEPPGAEHSRVVPVLAAVLVFVLASALLWASLFGLPALGGLPTIWRLLAGVLANFYLIRLAAGVAASLQRRAERASRQGDNPIL
ncbi:MAG TPA: hypothetical protein VN882_01585 [Steroidobacteraceae bacterium]|jgi:hypothetical protein|nr:hypothetical protein [Steroidobacteraceae bacterium]